tara:strand:- start:144 stop:728 length:585 start_codon:yes stop_codon:yes gene_type:complete
LLKISPYKIILASNSPRRKEFFNKLEIPYTIKFQKIKENFPSSLKENEITDYLVKLKAEKLKNKLKSNEILITADTIVWFNNKCLGKPKNKIESKKILNQLSGKDHTVITSVAISSFNKQKVFNEKSIVSFKKLKSAEIDFYVENFNTLDKAGGYGIQDWIGLIGIKKISGSYTNIVGLPVSQLLENIKFFINK